MIQYKIKKIIIFITLIITIISAVILFLPRSKTIDSIAKCYDCSVIKIPTIKQQDFDKLDYIDVECKIDITSNSFFITDIKGYIIIRNTKYNIYDYIYDKENNWYYCSIKDEVGNTNYTGLTLSHDLKFIRILYNDGKHNKGEKGMWFGPSTSPEELVEVLRYFKVTQ